MSTPTEPLIQPPPPSMFVTQQAYTAQSGHGAVGPVVAVLAVIAILGVIAAMIGRLCTGRSIMGYGQFDVEGWMERKCSSCLDGHVGHPPRPSRALPVASSANTNGSVRPSIPAEEIKEAEEEPDDGSQHSHAES
ncbi:hypothetical protein Nepgr_015261 [Nepenthes gracilis]|uniref:Transmembrane protein n=1 Tax=Nepenthes gracilis TaxID=150966 RepID=A0AAD3SML4_NEPGR|nr:hypothetical protein Nepgr_015261 [Nepenthes gracilis]